MIQFQFILKQMGRALGSEATRQSASTNLDKLIQALFRHSMTSDEAHHIGEMVRGIDSAIAGKVSAFLPIL